jgi:hypothetical protein
MNAQFYCVRGCYSNSEASVLIRDGEYPNFNLTPGA